MASVLIVDDEARIACFLSRALSASGFNAPYACTATAAIEMLGRESFDLVLLDLLLAEEDGVCVLEGALQLEPSPVVFVLSALSDVGSKVKCFELGASDYVTKPFVLAELVARIRVRIRQTTDLVGLRYLESKKVTLDLQRRVALIDGKHVGLSSREFQLLEHLMRKDGEVCPRQELLEAVWGYTFDPGSNVVDVYVRRLRGKLGVNVIETVRNVGYCYPPAA